MSPSFSVVRTVRRRRLSWGDYRTRRKAPFRSRWNMNRRRIVLGLRKLHMGQHSGPLPRVFAVFLLIFPDRLALEMVLVVAIEDVLEHFDCGMKKTCGIYRIVVRRPNFSPKYYIGQSIHIVARRATHFRDLRRGSHKNEMLQRAFAKYGEKAFSFEILLVCQRTKETLSMYEQAVLDSYAADELYNICKICVDSVWV